MVVVRPAPEGEGGGDPLVQRSFADMAEALNGSETNSIPASYFNNVLSAGDSADIFDSTNLTLAKATTIVRDSNLTEANRTEICILKTRTIGFWVSCSDLNTARDTLAGCGTQSAGLSFGGSTVSYSAVTEEYNGSSWSGGGALSTARSYLSGCGTQSAGLSFGGYALGYSAVTEAYW